MNPVPIVELSCLASVGEGVLSLKVTGNARVHGHHPSGGTSSLRKKRGNRRMVRGWTEERKEVDCN